MNKVILAVSVLAAAIMTSPAHASWQDGNGKAWDTIDQCMGLGARGCVWVGKMVDQTQEGSSVGVNSTTMRGGPVRDPLSYSLVRPGDVRPPDQKAYCLHADGGVSNMPLHSSTCPSGTREILAKAAKRETGIPKSR